MSLETMIVATGKKQNLSALVEDLELLKTMKRKGESSLAVTLHRVLKEYAAANRNSWS